MKNLILFAAMLFASPVFANVHTVSNDPAKPAQFASFTAAHNAANPKDTLYIYGSPNSYGQVEITKDLVIIGPGLNTTKENFLTAVFSTITLNALVFELLTLDGIVTQNLNIRAGNVINYSNVTIRNTVVTSTMSGVAGSPVACGSVFSNWLIENAYFNVFGTPTNSTCNPIAPVTNGFLVRNSFIVSLNVINHITFSNCQFGHDQQGSFNNVRFCQFNNSIFFRYNFTQTAANTNNQFNHCLTYLTNSPNVSFDLNNWTGGATGSANNCIINQNPLYVSVPTQYIFSTDPSTRIVWNPAMQPSSPAIENGSDGKNIGVTGGNTPFSVFSEPKLPVIRKFRLQNAIVPPDGKVTIVATASTAQ